MEGPSLTDIKATLGITGFIPRKSPHRRGRFGTSMSALIASWAVVVPGVGLFAIKAVRRAGFRNVVRQFGPLSARGAGNLRGAVLYTKRTGMDNRWCTSCSAKSIAVAYVVDGINAESI